MELLICNGYLTGLKGRKSDILRFKVRGYKDQFFQRINLSLAYESSS